MHPNFSAAHAKTLAQETIVSTAFNALLPTAVIWFLNVAPPQTLVGSRSILASLIPPAALGTFAMTLIVTMMIRTRVAKGGLPAFDWPRGERGRYRFIPKNLLLRAITLAIMAVAILVPIGFAVVAATGILPLTKFGLLIFNIVFGAAVGLLMTRFVVLAALADGAKR